MRFLQKNIKGCSFEGRKTQIKKKKNFEIFPRKLATSLSVSYVLSNVILASTCIYCPPLTQSFSWSTPCVMSPHLSSASSSSFRKYCNRRIPRPTFSLLFLLLLFLLDSYWLRETAKHAGSALEDWCMIVVPNCIFLLWCNLILFNHPKLKLVVNTNLNPVYSTFIIYHLYICYLNTNF